MPSLKLHRKYAELANLPIDICEAVDRFIDFGPKKIFIISMNLKLIVLLPISFF